MPNVGFNIYSRLNVENKPASGYSLPFEIFTFIPDFSNTGNNISNRKILWNFGDNTISPTLTAQHNYDYPGNYPITLTVFDSAGNGSLSTYLSTVSIRNLIGDSLILTTNSTFIQKSGEVTSPIYLTRYNSWQTVTSAGVIINLAVSGNRAPFFDMDEYNSDLYAHLKPSARFYIDNSTVVDAVTTTNSPIYALPAGNSITLSTSSSLGTYLAGSSGQAKFFYIEDFTGS